MISQRQLFLQYLAQTSEEPIQLEIEKAEGVYLYDISGKAYIDLISGISVSNLGHRHPKVVQAIKAQLDKYLYLMVSFWLLINNNTNIVKLIIMKQ